VSRRGHRGYPRQRFLALVSLAATGILAIAVIAFLVGNAGYLFVGLVGFVLAVAGAWWFITERMPRRALGVLAAVAGVGLQIAALVQVTSRGDQIALRLAVVIGLLAVTVLTARAALSEDLHQDVTQQFRRVGPPRHPVLLCNPWSGGGKVEKFGLVELASALGVRTIMLGHGLDLGQLARDAVAQGADCLGMAGGDGSQALVASIAVEHGLPFVCVSAGTRNHFALDLGLDREDPRASMYAFRDAVERRVDYATVNNRFFVNNVSLGIYATIVQQEGYRESKAETTETLLPELLGRRAEPFDLEFVMPDGTQVNGAFLIQVSNNPYVLRASLDASQRRRLDSGQLGVFAVTAATGPQAAEALTLALLGRHAKRGHAFEFTTDEFEVRSKSGKAYAGVDGEALELEAPLVFRLHPGGLRLFVPEGNAEVALRRGARDVRPRDLVSIATGAPSHTSTRGG
jgi:diacylglycerol kinase family enzyme